MLKTLSAALVAASLLIAPGLTVGADAAPRTGATTVEMTKKPKRDVVKHHQRHKHVKYTRHYKKPMLKTRHGKIVKAHKRSHVVAKTPRARAN